MYCIVTILVHGFSNQREVAIEPKSIYDGELLSEIEGYDDLVVKESESSDGDE